MLRTKLQRRTLMNKDYNTKNALFTLFPSSTFTINRQTDRQTDRQKDIETERDIQRVTTQKA